MKANIASRSWRRDGMGVVAGLAHSRRVRVLALVLAFAAYALGGASYAQKTKTPKSKFQTNKLAELEKTLEHEGLERRYILHKPEDLPANAPLLFVLHGRSGSNFWTYGLGFNDLADKNGFAVAYPQGEYRYMKGADPNDPKAMGWTEWNAHMDPTRVDDVDFLSSLARALQSEHSLNPDQTFVTGFSIGGYMSYALACKASETFKGVAIVASLMDHKLYVDNNPPPNPLPVLHIHGTADSLCPIDGNINKETGERE
jgi:polyhydroxybutyrate depolymerase